MSQTYETPIAVIFQNAEMLAEKHLGNHFAFIGGFSPAGNDREVANSVWHKKIITVKESRDVMFGH